MTTVYRLSDPITKKIRYVGVTNKKLEYRLEAHIKESEKGRLTKKNQWVLGLILKGKKPIIKPMVILPDDRFSLEIEALIIRRLYTEGYDLLNMTKHSNKFYRPIFESMNDLKRTPVKPFKPKSK